MLGRSAGQVKTSTAQDLLNEARHLECGDLSPLFV
ncbi:MAG: hypothetical protein QOE96_4149, partial [Blastocatellia bacterium]|nr:hypothetical protein [Blastocatellia bacterium]